mmetsp:Transcript_3004/g.4572  ORF Transcript_3004/g.4572 Transcript_3004/m.4572 type:complete len:129 (+) Transcript_3004:147-533(+)
MSFIGEGKYVGDGGVLLQNLWELWHWTEIKNCPGRYVTRRNRDAENTPPDVLLAQINVSDPVTLYQPETVKDAVYVCHFSDGGGLISYVKTEGARFVHTLNTESGFLRKTQALGIAVTGPSRNDIDDF